MPVAVVTAPYGRDAAAALRDAVAREKAGDPLAPVTVVVPTNYVGVTIRRLLGSGELGPLADGTVGVAGVTFLTVYRLAELLGAPALAAAGRRPVSTPVLAAAIRQVLARQPGMFASVATHPATEQALVDASRELAQCDDDALDALRRSGPRAADVVRVTGSARRLLAPQWYDERDLMDAAVAEIAIPHEIASPDADMRRSATQFREGGSALADLGAVVLYLPQDLAAPAARLLRAIADVGSVIAVVGVSGAARADAPVRAALQRLDPAGADGSTWDAEVPHGTHITSASDPDDEVRAVVRAVVGALRDGVPLERMAVLYGAADPYARLVHEQLDAAGIVHNGNAVRTLAQSVLGGSLLALLALPDRDFHRHDLMALLASAPVHQSDGRPAPAARWERISRRAGIVRGRRQWSDALAREIAAREHDVHSERARTDRDPRPEWLERELAATRDLRTFVTELTAELDAGAATGRTWRELAEWAQHLVDRRLAHAGRRDAWPAPERAAADTVEGALERLAGLDSVEPAPGIDVFRRTLALELDADLGRTGRLGEGVYVGPVASGLGLDLDRLFVCGLAEGTFPARIHDDSLLPDADRRAAGGALPLRADRIHDDHRRFLAALAAAPERALTFPRGDLRRTTERMPSRFLLDTVEALSGTRPSSDELLTRDDDWLTVVPSFTAGLARLTFPATEQEHRLRTLLDGARRGHDVAITALRASDRTFDRGLECTLARAGRSFTRFDGNLSAQSVPSPASAGAIVSPTRLETWAASPFEYFMGQVLRVEIPELPEEVWELSALDKGTLVHEILDTFLAEVLARDGGPPDPVAPWAPADHARLHELAHALGADYEQRGLTGRRVFWDRDRRRLLAELDRYLVEDARVRSEHALRPVATELRFGFDGAEQPAVEIALSDGRSLRFRGAADRVDRGDHGELSVVDYKTGRAVQGLKLQLPVYARAARAAFGDDATPVTAAYWYVSTKGGFTWDEVPLDEDTERTLDAQLRAIVDGVEGGVFPCIVDEPGTWGRYWRTYTDPDARGTRDRWREWVRKRDAPELRAFLELSGLDLSGVALSDDVADDEGDAP